jgi:hypothetical protein
VNRKDRKIDRKKTQINQSMSNDQKEKRLRLGSKKTKKKKIENSLGQ